MLSQKLRLQHQYVSLGSAIKFGCRVHLYLLVVLHLVHLYWMNHILQAEMLFSWQKLIIPIEHVRSLSMYTYIYIHIYISVYIKIYVCIYVYIHIYICICKNMHNYVYAYKHIYIYVYIYVCTCIDIYIYTR